MAANAARAMTTNADAEWTAAGEMELPSHATRMNPSAKGTQADFPVPDACASGVPEQVLEVRNPLTVQVSPLQLPTA